MFGKYQKSKKQVGFRKMYKARKPISSNNRLKSILGVVLVLAILLICFGALKLSSLKPANGQKVEVNIETGDRPLKTNTILYINAENGLSLRKDHSSDSERLTIIPNKTRVESTEELDGWYKITYNGTEGWISKEYTTLTAPPEDPTKEWSYYLDTNNGFKIKYPKGWKYQNYGSNNNTKAISLIAFSNQDLPSTLPEGSDFLAPVTLTVSSSTFEEINTALSSIDGATKEDLNVGSIAGKKYTYISVISNTQMTTIVFDINGKTVVLSEPGGYLEDLQKMVSTLTLGA